MDNTHIELVIEKKGNKYTGKLQLNGVQHGLAIERKTKKEVMDEFIKAMLFAQSLGPKE